MKKHSFPALLNALHQEFHPKHIIKNGDYNVIEHMRSHIAGMGHRNSRPRHQTAPRSNECSGLYIYSGQA